MSPQNVFSFRQAGIARHYIAWDCILLTLNCSTQRFSLSKTLPTNCSKDSTGSTKCGKERQRNVMILSKNLKSRGKRSQGYVKDASKSKESNGLEGYPAEVL